MATSNGGLRNMTEGSPAGHIFYFALPLLAAGAYAAYRYLPKLEPLMQVALKVVVIP